MYAGPGSRYSEYLANHGPCVFYANGTQLVQAMESIAMDHITIAALTACACSIHAA